MARYTATGTVPLPLNDTVSVGFTGSEPLMVTDADRAPAAVGLNVTLIVQFAPAATVVPHVLVCAKSAALAPVSPMLLIARSAVPVLDSVTVWAPLAVLTGWSPNARAEGATAEIGRNARSARARPSRSDLRDRGW